MGCACIPLISSVFVVSNMCSLQFTDCSDFSLSSEIEKRGLCAYDFHKSYAISFEDDQKLTVLGFAAPKNRVSN